MTEKKHRSVILFGEWQRPLGALSLEQKGMLLDALLAYPEGKRPISPTRCSGWRGPLWKGASTRTPASGRRPASAGPRRGQRGPRAAGTAKSVAKIANAMRRWQRWLYLVLIPSLILVLHLILSLSLILSSRMGRLTALTRPSRPRAEPDFCPPDEGEVRDYFIRKNGTEAQADRFRAFYDPTGWRVGQNPMRNWQAAATVWMARDRERPAPAETYVPKNKAFYATRPPEQAKDFLKDAALRRQAMRKRKEAVTQ